MKRILLALLIVTPFSFCQAQLQKGNMLLEGSLNISSESSTNEFNLFGVVNDTETSNTLLSFSPRLGWFTGNNALLGIGLTYEHRLFKVIDNFDVVQNNEIITRNNLFLINPYFTKFSPIADKLYLTTTINLAVGFGNESSDFTNNEQTADLVELRLNIVPGLTYFVSEKWALQANVGQLFYRYRRSKLSDAIPNELINSSSNYGISFSANTFRVGFQYFISRKSE